MGALELQDKILKSNMMLLNQKLICQSIGSMMHFSMQNTLLVQNSCGEPLAATGLV